MMVSFHKPSPHSFIIDKSISIFDDAHILVFTRQMEMSILNAFMNIICRHMELLHRLTQVSSSDSGDGVKVVTVLPQALLQNLRILRLNHNHYVFKHKKDTRIVSGNPFRSLFAPFFWDQLLSPHMELLCHTP